MSAKSVEICATSALLNCYVFLILRINMSNVMDTINHQDKKRDFKMVMVLAFVLVAISFFAIGFIYAIAPQLNILATLLVIFGGINSFLIYYLIKKLESVTTT